MSPIPPIPQMTELDESWIDWVAGTHDIRPEIARGMLAAYFTMRARHLAKGVESIKRDILLGEGSLLLLSVNKTDPPEMVAADIAMWNELLPQLRELAR